MKIPNQPSTFFSIRLGNNFNIYFSIILTSCALELKWEVLLFSLAMNLRHPSLFENRPINKAELFACLALIGNFAPCYCFYRSAGQ